MHTWKLTIQDDCSDVDGHVPVLGNMEVYIKADTIEEAIKQCYDWYTLDKIFILEAKFI